MAATLAERSAVPFHIGLTEPIDDTDASYPTVEGAYDPEEQVWKLPAGTLLSGPGAVEAYFFTVTYCYEQGHRTDDDGHTDA